MRYGGLLLILSLCGCGARMLPAEEPISTDPQVTLVKPTIRDVERVIGQPSFIDSYEQTAIYAKLPGYVLEWNVDIGDPIKTNQVLAKLYIPELAEECMLKKAQVEMDAALVEQSEKLVEVAQGNLAAARARVVQAQANVGESQALVVRWESEVKRETMLVEEDVLDEQILDESTRQLQASIAKRDAAIAAVQTAEADLVARKADLDKARVDVDVAKAHLKVSEADEKRVEALFSYTELQAPYDGIVVLRNINTGDFVLPATGDPSAASRSVDQSAAHATPLYVVARTDVVRVYVDVPEQDANYIVSRVQKDNNDPRPITKAGVLVPSYQNDEIPGEVTRSSWALNFKSRTLRAEIDLHNPDARLLPGMYAYGRVVFDRKHTMALPHATVTVIGNQESCYFYEDGKAVEIAIETGVHNDEWIEVLKKKINGQWVNFDGTEQVILGTMSELYNGEKVVVTQDGPAEKKHELAPSSKPSPTAH